MWVFSFDSDAQIRLVQEEIRKQFLSRILHYWLMRERCIKTYYFVVFWAVMQLPVPQTWLYKGFFSDSNLRKFLLSNVKYKWAASQ